MGHFFPCYELDLLIFDAVDLCNFVMNELNATLEVQGMRKLGHPKNEVSSETQKLRSATTNSNTICQKNHSKFFSKIFFDV